MVKKKRKLCAEKRRDGLPAWLKLTDKELRNIIKSGLYSCEDEIPDFVLGGSMVSFIKEHN